MPFSIVLVLSAFRQKIDCDFYEVPPRGLLVGVTLVEPT